MDSSSLRRSLRRNVRFVVAQEPEQRRSTSSDEQDDDEPPPAGPLEVTGLWSLLPDELMDIVLDSCTEKQLGMLVSSCVFFSRSNITERIALTRLGEIPRSSGLKPVRRLKESCLKLLHFVNCQSIAAAQGTSLACGAYHTAALLLTSNPPSKGGLHALNAFGRGFHGQLGLGSKELQDVGRPTVVSLGFRRSLVAPATREVCHEEEEETMAAVIACGAAHTVSISRRGELFTWGMGINGETGLGRWTALQSGAPRMVPLPPQVRIVSIAVGSHHTLAIAEDGRLFGFGRNTNGQLGNGTLHNSRGAGLVSSLSHHRIVSAAAGCAHSLALASDGSLFTWGDGRYGQLGLSSMQALVVNPLQAMVVLHPFKITRLGPADVPPPDRITAVAAGANHSVALTVAGAMLTFGRNEFGCLGHGDTLDRFRPSRVVLDPIESTHTTRGRDDDGGAGPRSQRVVQVACGAGHTLALVNSNGFNEVWSAGCNTWGQLGTGDRKHSSKFQPVANRIPSVNAVQAGDDHSCAVTNLGALYVWGRGDCGQLGIGDGRSKWRPTLLPGAAVVHPDRTLRRLFRTGPLMRPVPDATRRQHREEQWHCQ